MSAPLPPSWTEEIDDKGRTYYSNHRTKETTWQRPAAPAAAAAQEFPPPYSGKAYAPRQPAPGASPSGPCCTPRLTFWLSCGLGWIVWAFAVAVSVDNAWIDESYFDYAALDEELLDSCYYSTGVCDLYKAFSAMQAIAVVLVSVAMVVQMIAIFRPASGQCCSVKALALAGGILMAAFAFFQMLAFILVVVIEKEIDDDWYSYSDAKLGPTFGVAVVACLMGMVQAASVLTFARSAGDGPAFKCCNECMLSNRDPSHAAVQGGGGVYYQQPQPATHQQAPYTSASGTGLPQPAPAGEGNPPEPASAAV